MRITSKSLSDTSIKLTIAATGSELNDLKAHTVDKLSKNLKVPGFRAGKVPPTVAEKQLDSNYLQSQVLDEALNHLYSEAVAEQKIRVVAQPKVDIVKFVPYTDLEFTAEVEVIGKIELPDYTKVTAKKSTDKVTEAEVKEVLGRLQTQTAEYKEVERASKNGDRVWIDFEGTDAKGEPVEGAKGEEYPLALGSNTFIPGFEENVVGLKMGEEKSFTIPFPKDYHVKALQGKKVTFKITAKKVEETITQELDDEFAAKVGPFTSLDDLKKDIRTQMQVEKDTTAQRDFEDAIIKDLIAKSKVALPEALLNEQIELVDREFRQNLTYRGQTMPEYLEATGQTEEQYRKNELKKTAEDRLKAGLILSEIAELEKIDVEPVELDQEIAIRKAQYASDASMQAELDKPENRRDVAARLLTQKTIAKLVSYAK